MKPVIQRGSNDCLAASIASLLEIPLELVPVFPGAKTAESQLSCTNKWLSKLGYCLVEVKVDRSGQLNFREQHIPIHCIVTMSVPGSNYDHAVVGKLHKDSLEVIFDPGHSGYRHPKSKVLAVAFLVKIAG